MDDKKIEALYGQAVCEDMPKLWERIESRLSSETSKADSKSSVSLGDDTYMDLGRKSKKPKRHKRKRIFTFVLAAVVLMAVLAVPMRFFMGMGGMKGGSGAVSSDSSAAYDKGAGAPQMNEAAPEEMYFADGEYGEDDYKSETWASDTGSTTTDSAMSAVSDSKATADSGRKLIKNASMTVETLEFDAFLDNLEASVEQMGGYYENASVEGNDRYGSSRFADFIIRIPQERLGELTGKIGELGNILYQNETVEDITLKYTDTQARIQALKIQQDNLLALLEKAETVEDMITVESRLSEISYELEYYQSIKNTYDNQVNYSTVTMEVREVKKETPKAPKTIWERMRSGLADTFDSIAYDFENLIVSLVVDFPYIVIFAVFAGVAVVIGRKIYKRVKNKK